MIISESERQILSLFQSTIALNLIKLAQILISEGHVVHLITEIIFEEKRKASGIMVLLINRRPCYITTVYYNQDLSLISQAGCM